MTNSVTLCAALAVALALILAVVGGRLGQGGVRYCRGRFLSGNEKAFLVTLDRVLGPNFRVFAQVCLADLVGLERGGSRRARWRALSQVFGKSVDFVICDRSSFDPVMVLEVDDRSHEARDRRRRDALVDRVCAEARLPLLRIKARRSYPPNDVAAALTAAGLGRAPIIAGKDA